AILDRQFPAILFPRTVNEYGELGVMYPYMFLVFPAVLRICRVSLLTAYDVTIFCTAAAVVSVMYYALRTLQVSSLSAALSATLYLLSPSFVHAETDNGAVLGNGISYIFIPLVIAGLLHLLQGNGNRWPLLTIGFTGLLQSHLVTTLLVLVCAVLLLCILIPVQLSRGRGRAVTDCIPDFLKAGIWCLLINIWWIVPFLYYYKNGNLYLGALGEGFWTFDLPSFISYESGQYAIILCIWLIVMIAIAFSSKKISENVYFAAALFLVGLVLVAACTMIFPWDMLRRLYFFRFFSNTMQFPYRFFFAAFAFLIFGIGMLADRIRMWLEKKQKFLPYCIAMLFILLPVLLYDNHIMKEYSSPDRISYTVITGDIAPYKQREYLPLGTEDEYFSGRDYRLSDENAVRITDYQKRGDKADFVYYYIEGNERKEEYIELPLFLYPGYQIRLSEGAVTLPTESGKENHMRIYLPFSKTEKKVEVFFTVNPVFTFLTVFSALAFAAMLFCIKSDREIVKEEKE
nr:hypothetical protein [Lachnospiraceae bacterium]